MSVVRRQSISSIRVRCVMCVHRFDTPLTSEMPMCPQCYGPVVVVHVETKSQANPEGNAK